MFVNFSNFKIDGLQLLEFSSKLVMGNLYYVIFPFLEHIFPFEKEDAQTCFSEHLLNQTGLK